MLNANPTFDYLLRRAAMKTLTIKDLARNDELDRKAMTKVYGGRDDLPTIPTEIEDLLDAIFQPTPVRICDYWSC